MTNKEIIYLNEYTYVDRSGIYPREVFRCMALTIMEADMVAREAGINTMKLACGVGGRLICFDNQKAIRRAILTPAQSYNRVVDSKNIPARQELVTQILVDPSKYALNIYGRSLNEVLANHARQINIYRWSGSMTFKWVNSSGFIRLVRSLDPVTSNG